MENLNNKNNEQQKMNANPTGDKIQVINAFNIKQFIFNVEQLNYRVQRAWNIDTLQHENQNEYLMAFDSALCLFRAMFLERDKDGKNYTYQNFFKFVGEPQIADEIDKYLDTTPFVTGVSIRKALKFIADKYVCHVDKIDSIDLGLANYYMSALKNPYVDHNLKCIMAHLNEIIRKSTR